MLNLTKHSSILESQYPPIDVSVLQRIRRSLYCEMLRRARSCQALVESIYYKTSSAKERKKKKLAEQVEYILSRKVIKSFSIVIYYNPTTSMSAKPRKKIFEIYP